VHVKLHLIFQVGAQGRSAQSICCAAAKRHRGDP
jgi:hypothetical protein